MLEILQVADVAIAIERKKIKNMYLKVRPPAGDVCISAPERMSAETIRLFALSKLPWIQKQRQKIQAQVQVIPQEYQEHQYVTGASYFLWGDRHILAIQEVETSPQINLQYNTIQLQIRPNTSQQQRGAILAQWQRNQLKRAIPTLIQRWEPIMQVQVNKFFVRQMKTKWGSCNITKRTIRLNTALAQKPKHCLEYVVVHEMNHLLERYHNQRFKNLMDLFLPNWQHSQAVLNRFPVNQ
jgi:predicted metal-dependent hydrolase